MTPKEYTDKLMPLIVASAERARPGVLAAMPFLKRSVVGSVWGLVMAHVVPILVRLTIEVTVDRSRPTLGPVLHGFLEGFGSSLSTDRRAELADLVSLYDTPANQFHPALRESLGA